MPAAQRRCVAGSHCSLRLKHGPGRVQDPQSVRMLTLSDHQRVLNDLYLTRVNGRFPNKPMCHIKSQLSGHYGMIVNMLTYGRGQGKSRGPKTETSILMT